MYMSPVSFPVPLLRYSLVIVLTLVIIMLNNTLTLIFLPLLALGIIC